MPNPTTCYIQLATLYGLRDLVLHAINISIIIIIIIIISGSAAQRGLWPPRPRGFLITHNDAPHSVGLLWTSNQLVAETST
jgi:hypothetical protein